jgi:O-antigen ligase
MIRRYPLEDYRTVTRSQQRRVTEPATKNHVAVGKAPVTVQSPESLSTDSPHTFLKRGHVLSFGALFLFTIILYARPAEFYPSAWTNSLALIVGLVTLVCFTATQISLEGTLTARTPEVYFVLLLMVTALFSIPLALNPAVAWETFTGTFIRCVVIFIVIVNVVRTEARLKGILFLALASAIWLSVGAINDYRLGLMTVEGYRAGGRGGGIFGNSNDMALHLVTILPISIALLFGSRGLARKLIFGVCAAVMLAAIVLSYSRGAFIGLVVVLIFLTMKIGRGNRLGISLAIVVVAAGFLFLAPGNYGGRLLSIFIPSLDTGGSADFRRDELFRSLYVSLRHPFLGIGMGNYQPMISLRGLVTHNSYTQVAAEMGMAALACYLMFIVTPLRKLAQIGRETFKVHRSSNFHYLALGLQASLLAYIVSSFFLSVAFSWYVYYLVGLAVCLRRIYESETGKVVVVEKRKERKKNSAYDTVIGEVGLAI